MKEVAKTDQKYQMLLEKVNTGTFATTQVCENPEIREFFNVKDRLSVIDGLLLYTFEDKQPRIVIPTKLRPSILDHLHKANQGSTSMIGRARAAVYWPRIDEDIQQFYKNCQDCREHAPSYQKEHMQTTPPPEFPMLHLVADLFNHNGREYLA